MIISIVVVNLNDRFHGHLEYSSIKYTYIKFYSTAVTQWSEHPSRVGGGGGKSGLYLGWVKPDSLKHVVVWLRIQNS